MRELKWADYDEVPELRNVVLHNKYLMPSHNLKTYICITCHRALSGGQIPAQAMANGLELDDMPKVMQDLNEVEVRLISLQVWFIQLKSLPKGGQKGMRGPAVNVPANLGPVCSLLPRLPSSAHLITLNFKRKLEYKSYYISDNIRPAKVMQALNHLLLTNPHYRHVRTE